MIGIGGGRVVFVWGRGNVMVTGVLLQQHKLIVTITHAFLNVLSYRVAVVACLLLLTSPTVLEQIQT